MAIDLNELSELFGSDPTTDTINAQSEDVQVEEPGNESFFDAQNSLEENDEPVSTEEFNPDEETNDFKEQKQNSCEKSVKEKEPVPAAASAYHDLIDFPEDLPTEEKDYLCAGCLDGIVIYDLCSWTNDVESLGLANTEDLYGKGAFYVGGSDGNVEIVEVDGWMEFPLFPHVFPKTLKQLKEEWANIEARDSEISDDLAAFIRNSLDAAEKSERENSQSPHG